MAYITDYQYYENGGNAPEDANWGSYQYVSLQDIVNNFHDHRHHRRGRYLGLLREAK